MGKVLKNPPLVGATAQIVFTGSDDIRFEDIYVNVKASLKDLFPKIESVEVRTFSVGSSGTLVSQIQQIPRLSSQDGKVQITINGRVVTIERLKPYKDWASYKSSIQSVIDSYVAHGQVTGVSRLGIRYINEIHSPAAMSEAQVFKVGIQNTSPFTVISSAMVIELDSDTQGEKTKVHIARKKGALDRPDVQVHTLDIDHQLQRDMDADTPEIMQHFEAMHDRVEKIFLELPTEEIRRTFNEV